MQHTKVASTVPRDSTEKNSTDNPFLQNQATVNQATFSMRALCKAIVYNKLYVRAFHIFEGKFEFLGEIIQLYVLRFVQIHNRTRLVRSNVMTS